VIIKTLYGNIVFKLCKKKNFFKSGVSRRPGHKEKERGENIRKITQKKTRQGGDKKTSSKLLLISREVFWKVVV
jgi:hypothetical protein